MNLFSGVWQSILGITAVVVAVAGAWWSGRASGKRYEQAKAEVAFYRQRLKQQETASNAFIDQVEIMNEVQDSDDNLDNADARMRMRQSTYHRDGTQQ